MHTKHATWDAVDSFSLGNMQKITEINALVLWEIVSYYVNPDPGMTDNPVVVVCRYRPQNVVYIRYSTSSSHQMGSEGDDP